MKDDKDITVQAASERLDSARRARSKDDSAEAEYFAARLAYANVLEELGRSVPQGDPMGTGTE